MLQTQTPVRRWKQWLALPVLGGLFLVACQSINDQPLPSGDNEAMKQAHKEVIMRKTREALYQDSLHNKLEPGTMRQFNIANMNGKPEDITVTITHKPIVPPPPVAMPANQLAAQSTEAGRIYTYVEQMPALPTGGGMGGIVNAIQQNMLRTAAEISTMPEGRLFVSFTVGAEGTVRDVKMVKGLDPAYDEAAMEAIRQLPRFISGKQDGKAVAVSFTVPIQLKPQ